MEVDLNKLGSICLHVSEDHSDRKWLTVPFTFAVNGDNYVMASNTKALVAVRHEEDVDFGPEFTPPEHTKKTVPSIFSFPKNATIKRFESKPLLDWAGEPDWGYVEAPCPDCDGENCFVKCDDCNGKGEVEVPCEDCDARHDCPCRSCGGEGQVECECIEGKVIRKPDPRPAVMCETPIDQNLLARALACVPEVPDVVSVVTSKKMMVRISCDDWVVIIMGMSQAPEGAPTFN